MDLKLNGRRALVTGSSSGLGAATARMLAGEGATVVVHGRDESRARAVVDSIIAVGGSAELALGDLSADVGADDVATEAQQSGPVDILVNNAGVYDHMSWNAATAERWADIYNVNVISGVRMIQRLVEPMKQRGWGRVITIGGGLASQPMNTQPHYNATLAARHNLAVSLARDLKGTGVTSNIVSPGAILVDSVADVITDMAPERGWTGTSKQIQEIAAEEWVPNDIGRFGDPDEIAAAVAYLCSEHAAYVSGATIRVDGGVIRTAF